MMERSQADRGADPSVAPAPATGLMGACDCRKGAATTLDAGGRKFERVVDASPFHQHANPFEPANDRLTTSAAGDTGHVVAA